MKPRRRRSPVGSGSVNACFVVAARGTTALDDQAEWCPHSSRVRQRLTELGVSFVARQVPAEPADREELRRKTGSDEIPALIDDGEPIAGDADALIAYLDRSCSERADAAEHRRQARLHDRAA